MWGESWLAIKDSLTHCPSSQGWAPRVLHLCCSVCVMCSVSVSFVLGKGTETEGGRRYLSILSSVLFLAGMLCKIIPLTKYLTSKYTTRISSQKRSYSNVSTPLQVSSSGDEMHSK